MKSSNFNFFSLQNRRSHNGIVCCKNVETPKARMHLLTLLLLLLLFLSSSRQQQQQLQQSLQSVTLATMCRTVQTCRPSLTAPPPMPCEYPFAVLCNTSAVVSSPDSCFAAKSQCAATCAQCAPVALLFGNGSLPIALPTEFALNAPPISVVAQLPPGGTGVIDVSAAFLAGSPFDCAPTDTWAPRSAGTCNATQCALSCTAVVPQSQGRCMRGAISSMCDCVCARNTSAMAAIGDDNWLRVARLLRTASPPLWGACYSRHRYAAWRAHQRHSGALHDAALGRRAASRKRIQRRLHCITAIDGVWRRVALRRQPRVRRPIGALGRHRRQRGGVRV
jgi:hypothetical protein